MTTGVTMKPKTNLVELDLDEDYYDYDNYDNGYLHYDHHHDQGAFDEGLCFRMQPRIRNVHNH